MLLGPGITFQRPAFDKLQAAVFAGEIGTIVTYKLDRLSRVYDLGRGEMMTQQMEEKKEPVGRQNGRFVKGHPGGPGRGKIGDACIPLSEESQGMLAAMQHVVTRPASRDTTYEQREYRKWLKEDRKGFMNRKAELEKAVIMAEKRQAPQSPEDEPDEGTERVTALIEQILEEAGTTECPNCKTRYKL